jgi:RIO kinase 1
MDRLQQLLEDGVIDEVYQQLKSGKEAEVWLVSHGGEACAAKLYKDRDTRGFKNDAGYREGRVVRNTRTQRAMDKGSRFGRAAAEDAWKSAEADAMFALHAAGVHVPKPVLFYEGVLLMEVIGDAEGRVAPRLVDAGITREQAGPLYRRLRGDVVRMLAADWIHGDLSEFNVLLGVNGPVIIDFPQVVTAAKNSQSERYFRRDLGNLVRFFSSIDPALAKHERDADDIWRAYVRRHLTPDYEPSNRQPAPPQHGGRGGPPGDRGRPPRGPASTGHAPGQRQGPPREARPPQGGPSAQPPRGQPQGTGASTHLPRGAPGTAGGSQRTNNGVRPPRRGPEVVVKGASAAAPPARQEPRRDHGASSSGQPSGNRGGTHRRRPRRRF